MKHLYTLLFIFSSLSIYSQKIYAVHQEFIFPFVRSQIISIDINTCDTTMLCSFVDKYISIAFHPDGSLYLLTKQASSLQNSILYKYDLENCNAIDSFDMNFSANPFFRFNHEAEIFFSFGLKYNLITMMYENINYLNGTFFTFKKGKYYTLSTNMSGDNLFGEVIDTSLIIKDTLSKFPYLYRGIMNTNDINSCTDSNIIYIEKEIISETESRLISYNIFTKEKRNICKFPGFNSEISSICSPTEFLGADPECDLLLDLDRDNSSGLFPYNYKISSCTIGGASICDDDVYLHTSQTQNYTAPAVDSMRLTLSVVKDGFINEKLEAISLPLNMIFYQLNDSTYILKSTKNVADSIYMNALKAINYSNKRTQPTAGERIIKIIAYSDLKQSTEVRAFLNVQSKPNAGQDKSYISCDKLIINDIIKDIGGESNGTFYPSLSTINKFDSNIDKYTSYKYVTHNESCGNDTAIVSIKINPLPNKVLPKDTSICKGDIYSINLNTLNTILWNDGSTTKQKNLNIGTHIISITDSNMCSISDTILIRASTKRINYYKKVDLCAGDTYFYLGKYYMAGDSLFYIASPTVGCDSLVKVEFGLSPYRKATRDTFTCDNKPFLYHNKNYKVGDTIKIIKNNLVGCDSLIEVVYKQRILPLLNLIASQDTICKNDTTSIKAIGGIKYLWNTGETKDNILVSTGKYSVTITDRDQCTSVLEKVITLYPSIIYEIVREDSKCNEENGVISVITPKTNQVSINGTIRNELKNLREGSYEVEIIDKNGCEEKTTVTIENIGGPTIEIPRQITIEKNTEFLVKYESSTKINSIYSVSPGVRIVDNQVFITGTIDAFIELMFIDEWDCIVNKLIELTIKDNQELVVPNIIYLSSNNTNNTWTVTPPKGTEILRCKIYDRWNNVVYSINNQTPIWDGTMNNKTVESGVYLYSIQLKNNKGIEWKHGDITVIK